MENPSAARPARVTAAPAAPQPARGPGQPAAPAPRAPGPQPQRPVLEHRYPVGAIDLPCLVRAEIEPRLVGKKLHLRFTLVNLGQEAATVTLRGTCPQGVVKLGGLPDGFDPMHTCRMGACKNPDATTTYTIPPGRKRVVLGETVLNADGDSCNPALPGGSSFLQAKIDPAPPAFQICSGAFVHLVRDGAQGKLRLASSIEAPVPRSEPKRPAPKVKPTRPGPKVKPARPAPPVRPAPAPAKPKNCPTCGFGCLDGVPATGVDANGCPRCGCEGSPLTR